MKMPSFLTLSTLTLMLQKLLWSSMHVSSVYLNTKVLIPALNTFMQLLKLQIVQILKLSVDSEMSKAASKELTSVSPV